MTMVRSSSFLWSDTGQMIQIADAIIMYASAIYMTRGLFGLLKTFIQNPEKLDT